MRDLPLGFTVNKDDFFFFFLRQKGFCSPFPFAGGGGGVLTVEGTIHPLPTLLPLPLFLPPPSTTQLFVNKAAVPRGALRPHQT